MPVILNISERRPLPEVEVEALRDIARHNPTETLIVGQRRMTLHYIQLWTVLAWSRFRALCLSVLGTEDIVALQKTWRDSLTGVALFCRKSQHIWHRPVLLRLCR